MQAEANAQAAGAPPRDLSSYSAWREEADRENLELLETYGTLLIGQHAGMTNALSLDAVLAAMWLEGVPRAEWRDRARRLVLVHGLYLEHTKERK